MRSRMALPDTPNDARTLELLARVRDGDGEAWERLYRLYHDELLFSIRQKLGPRLRSVLQSEDVLQSVALAAFRDLPRFEHRGAGSLRAFLHTLVLNKIRDRADYFGAQKRSAPTVPWTASVDEGAGADREPHYHDSERFERLERCLAALPESMREAILLRRFEGLSNVEAAQQLGKTEQATRKLYSRAVARLTVLMTAGEGEGQ